MSLQSDALAALATLATEKTTLDTQLQTNLAAVATTLASMRTHNRNVVYWGRVGAHASTLTTLPGSHSGMRSSLAHYLNLPGKTSAFSTANESYVQDNSQGFEIRFAADLTQPDTIEST